MNIGTRHEINDISNSSKYPIAIEIKWKYMLEYFTELILDASLEVN